jgi:biofilm PGA synthesis N-glycosyltransferase PgaC
MLTDWIHWLSCRHPEQLLAFLWALLLVDSPRYAFSKLFICWWDLARGTWHWFRGTRSQEAFTYCPSVCTILSAYNEEATIEAALVSVCGSYPKLQIIVVTDGSTDQTPQVARAFADKHPEVMVLHRSERGGKASAVNFALNYAQAEVIVIMDTDSHLGPSALWEIVQPLRDPEVAAVSASVLVRNPFFNLASWFQAYEYLQTIFVGRMVSAKAGILGVVSGAFGAFRRETLDRSMGYDVGPDEDTDLTLFVRKTGFKVAFAPYAQCFTGVPTNWYTLFKQRRRWDLGEIIRCYCRKHIDLAYVWNRNFRLGNLICLMDSWFFRIFFQVGIWAWLIWFLVFLPADWGMILLTLYLGYLLFEMIQVLTVFYFSLSLKRDILVCAVLPLVPFYQLFLFLIRSLALVEETFFRKSFDQDYVPARVRQATWRW